MTSGKSDYEEMAEACYKNARQLYLDSVALKKRRSKGHAYSLLVLSIEETVKSMIYCLASDGLVKFRKRGSKSQSTMKEQDLLDHRMKHEILAQMISYSIVYSPFWGAFDNVKEDMIAKKNARVIIAEAIASHNRLQVDLNDPNSQISKNVRRMMDLLGRLNREKNLGFYVDRQDGKVLRPNRISSSNYEYWRSFQELFLESIRTLLSEGIDPEIVRPFRESGKAIAKRMKEIERRRTKNGKEKAS